MTGPPVSLEVGVSAPHIGTHRAGERCGVVLTGPTPSRLTSALLPVRPAPSSAGLILLLGPEVYREMATEIFRMDPH